MAVRLTSMPNVSAADRSWLTARTADDERADDDAAVIDRPGSLRPGAEQAVGEIEEQHRQGKGDHDRVFVRPLDLAERYRAHQGALDEHAEGHQRHDREKDARSRRQADHAGREIARIAAEHIELPMRKVDDAQDTENQRQPQCGQRVEGTDDQSVQRLLADLHQTHAYTSLRGADGATGSPSQTNMDAPSGRELPQTCGADDACIRI